MSAISRRDFVAGVAGAGAALAAGASPLAPGGGRPNILYIIMEDINPALGCYGVSGVRTPHVDAFAAQSIRFSSAFCCAPVCSASRSAIFTGCYQTFIGAQQHRTWAWDKPRLQAPIRHLCDWFRDAGYYTCNLHPSAEEKKRLRASGHAGQWGARGSGKLDLNFVVDHPHPDDPFEGYDWTQRGAGQPFFAHITIIETHKGQGWKTARKQPARELVDPDSLDLPPYWPDTPVSRDEYANYFDVIHLSDGYVGQLLARLKAEGLAENTIVVLGSDHGALFRGKQFLYDDGMRIPLLVRFPDGRGAGTVDDRLVSAVDLAPTMLGFAGIRPQAGAMQGMDLFDRSRTPRDCVFAARDRMDNSIDRMRAVRTRRHKYIRNELPAIPYMQHNLYKETFYPTWNLVKTLAAEGALPPVQARFAAVTKPIEELYDLENDPFETQNLADSRAHRSALRELRGRLDAWMRATDRARTYEDVLDIHRGYFGHLPDEGDAGVSVE